MIREDSFVSIVVRICLTKYTPQNKDSSGSYGRQYSRFSSDWLHIDRGNPLSLMDEHMPGHKPWKPRSPRRIEQDEDCADPRPAGFGRKRKFTRSKFCWESRNDFLLTVMIGCDT